MEVIQELLTEIMLKFNRNQNDEFLPKTRTKSWDLMNNATRLLLDNFSIDTKSNEILSLKYLIDSYNRAVRIGGDSGSFDSIKNECKQQIVNYSLMLVNGAFSSQSNL